MQHVTQILLLEPFVPNTKTMIDFRFVSHKPFRGPHEGSKGGGHLKWSLSFLLPFHYQPKGGSTILRKAHIQAASCDPKFHQDLFPFEPIQHKNTRPPSSLGWPHGAGLALLPGPLPAKRGSVSGSLSQETVAMATWKGPS